VEVTHAIMEVRAMERHVALGATKLTYDDLALFADDGKRHELVDGEHFMTPSPGSGHQWVAQRLNGLLYQFVEAHRLGRVYFAPLDVVFTPHDVVEPDLLFVSADRLGIITPANVQGAPDLVVEILSPASRRHDEVRKLALYDRAGVVEYWLVDAEAETVKAFRRQGPHFGRPDLLGARHGDVLRTPLLPGLEIRLADVFAP
jgi:Uma2 family endonuclease